MEMEFDNKGWMVELLRGVTEDPRIFATVKH